MITFLLVVSVSMNVAGLAFILLTRQKVDGTIDVLKDVEGRTTFLLNLESDPEQLEDKKMVIFKVKRDVNTPYNETTIKENYVHQKTPRLGAEQGDQSTNRRT